MPPTPVLAPVTGPITEILIPDGSIVRVGQIIIVQSATKTEAVISAPVAGKLTLLVEKGIEARQGDRLAEISIV